MMHRLLTGNEQPHSTQTAASMHGKPAAGAVKQDAPTTTNPAVVAGVAIHSKPVIGFVLLAIILFGLRMVKDAAEFASDHDKTRFREVDLTLWNMLAVGLIAMPSIVFWKFVSNKWLHPQNPFRTMVNAV